jgi:hypothetical protein
LLVGGGSIYLFLHTFDTGTFMTQSVIPGVPQDIPQAMPVVPFDSPDAPLFVAVAEKPLRQPSVVSVFSEEELRESTIDIMPEPLTEEREVESSEEIPPDDFQVSADVALLPPERRTPSSRKWGFGMGLGGLTQNSGEVVNTYVLRSSNYLEDEELLVLNAASDQNLGKLPRTNIKHKTPISFGLSVSRMLHNRFSLQTGLVYSLLLSDWETQATAYNNKTRQTLHFVGIPLSLSYKIAEWNHFQVYASAGMLSEVNVAGRLKVRQFSGGLQTGIFYVNQRMKEWQWSVNARAGISYPFIPHISAFAEIGGTYYFDNGSDMEMIYSDKPFNINPQVGFRLSF